MNFLLRALRRGSAPLIAAAAVMACTDSVVSPARRSISLAAPASRSAISMSARHIFMHNGNVPDDFARRVEAKGGHIDKVQGEVGLAVTSGLSDADANELGRGATVVHDFTARWVPTAQEMGASLPVSFAGELQAESALPPQSAAFLAFQWGLRQVHAPEAWTTFTGRPTVRVAILDSGLDPDHLDQRGLIDVTSSIAFVPSLGGGPPWSDDHFHGTFVGGIVTSNDFGTAGVVPNVTLIAVKVLDATGNGSLFNVLQGIIHATNVGANVVNMSLGAYIQKSDPDAKGVVAIFNRVMNYAHRNGVLLVSSAGNEAADLQHLGNIVEVPCEVGVGMCVSATSVADEKASYSNYGTSAINVAAPGGDAPPTPATLIIGLCSTHSIDPALAFCKTGSYYIFAAGTSMAAPFVAGLGAYLYSQHPDGLQPSRAITLIQQNADDLGKPGADPDFGKGRINVVNTLVADR